jgi:hypothetical protein
MLNPFKKNEQFRNPSVCTYKPKGTERYVETIKDNYQDRTQFSLGSGGQHNKIHRIVTLTLVLVTVGVNE